MKIIKKCNSSFLNQISQPHKHGCQYPLVSVCMMQQQRDRRGRRGSGEREIWRGRRGSAERGVGEDLERGRERVEGHLERGEKEEIWREGAGGRRGSGEGERG